MAETIETSKKRPVFKASKMYICVEQGLFFHAGK
jgi:hypothetical protein